ncbi:MAG: hypothetical protein K6E20_06725 [Acholeplasmatales bacterium]|nr:hypothetical protein [Acholeplasmatales bacterium]
MDYSYVSVFMYETPEYKEKLKEFKTKTNYSYKFKISWQMILCMIGIPLSIIITFMTVIYLLILTAVIIAYLVVLIRREQQNKNKDFLDKFERYLKSNEKDDFICCSAIYDTYYKCDEQKKEFSFKYGDKTYVYFPYNEIKSYDIFLDRYKIDKKKLTEVPDPRIRSYIITLNLDNNRKIEIGYSNANKHIKLKKSFVFQQFCNTVSINLIAKALDKIIYKNEKKK